MAFIEISQLPPAPNGTGSGTPKGTDIYPATDITDLSSAPSGTTKKYTRASAINFLFNALAYNTYTAVAASATSALTVTYANGAAGVGATLTNNGAQAALVIDGYHTNVGDRILVYSQAAGLQNGIYTVTNVGSGSTNWVMTRATDDNSSVLFVKYAAVLINGGATNAGKMFQQTSASGPNVGTDSITYGQASLIYNLVAGSGISITPGANFNSISTTGSLESWVVIAGTSQAAAINTGYIIGNAAQTTVTLPATAPAGSLVSIAGNGAGGWILAANGGQTIKVSSSSTSSGGSLTSNNQYDSINLVCIVANTTWAAIGAPQSAGLTIA